MWFTWFCFVFDWFLDDKIIYCLKFACSCWNCAVEEKICVSKSVGCCYSAMVSLWSAGIPFSHSCLPCIDSRPHHIFLLDQGILIYPQVSHIYKPSKLIVLPLLRLLHIVFVFIAWLVSMCSWHSNSQQPGLRLAFHKLLSRENVLLELFLLLETKSMDSWTLRMIFWKMFHKGKTLRSLLP